MRTWYTALGRFFVRNPSGISNDESRPRRGIWGNALVARRLLAVSFLRPVALIPSDAERQPIHFSGNRLRTVNCGRLAPIQEVWRSTESARRSSALAG